MMLRNKQDIRSFPIGRTEWLSFNLATGPFAGDSGRNGRLALSQAIDRVALAKAACASRILCFPATGGLISKGLSGYLGDGSNSVLGFDPAAARANLQAWDPSGSKRKQIKYFYITNSLFRNVANNLRQQWHNNLGIDVTLQGYDPDTFIYDRNFDAYALFRGSWGGDYDSPKDWYDNLFLGSAPSGGTGYVAAQFVNGLAEANTSTGATALMLYQQADRMLLDQAVLDPLLYYVHTVVVKPYVRGFGANALYEYRWTEISILQH
jgi:oligopeptide transport system substrate-binding protein